MGVDEVCLVLAPGGFSKSLRQHALSIRCNWMPRMPRQTAVRHVGHPYPG